MEGSVSEWVLTDVVIASRKIYEGLASSRSGHAGSDAPSDRVQEGNLNKPDEKKGQSALGGLRLKRLTEQQIRRIDIALESV